MQNVSVHYSVFVVIFFEYRMINVNIEMWTTDELLRLEIKQHKMRNSSVDVDENEILKKLRNKLNADVI